MGSGGDRHRISLPSKTNLKKQRAALKKLKSVGLYSGKLPRMNAVGGGRLSSYQQKLVKQFDAVAKGRAKVLTPKHPKDYAKLFTVRGNKVIVPKGKGERVTTNKAGNIVRERKGPRGEKIKGVFHRRKPAQMPPPPPPERRIQYAIPFARKLGKNRYRLEWKRFPSYESLASFMKTYETEGRYSDWANFVFEEEISSLPQAERDAALNSAAVKFGRAKSENEFETGSQLSPIMRAARTNRRRKKRRGQRSERGH